MRRFILLMLAVFMTTSVLATTPPLVASTEPEHETATVTLERVWSRGGEDDEEVLFGIPRAVTTDTDGNVFVLDNQLAQIVAFDPDGELIGILGRDGEGPGEFQRPSGLVALPDGEVAAGSAVGARFERLALDGTPRGTLRLGDDAPQEGMLILYGATQRGGTLLAGTATSAFDQSNGQMHRVQNLGTFHLDGRPRGSLCEATLDLDFTGTRPLEEVTLLRHFLVVSTVGPDGLVFVPHSRDEYVIDVFDADGHLVRQISRPDFEAPSRTDRDHRRLTALYDTWIRNSGIQIQFVKSKCEMTVQSMFVDDRGNLFVRHAASNRDLPEGAFLRLDEFAPDGTWTREVLVRGVGDPHMDTLEWLGDGRVAVQRGGVLNAIERWSDAAVYWEDEAEISPELVVCDWRP